MSKKALVPPAGVEPLKGRTDRQIEHIRSIKNNPQTVVLGPAGTGKTYISVASACNLLLAEKIDQIVISRPMVGADESIGYLPGDEGEKIAPWMAPIIDIMNERLGQGNVKRLLEDGVVRFEPFAFMVGKTFHNAFILLDEAQNCSIKQIQQLVTRTGGDNSKLVIDGDIRQKYVRGESGLGYLLNRIERYELQERGVGLIEYEPTDVVRGPICKMWVEIFEKDFA